MLDRKAEQLVRKSLEQQENLLEWKDKLENKKVEIKDLIEHYKAKLQNKGSVIRSLKQGSQVFADDMSLVEKEYEKKIEVLELQVCENEEG
ncbi:hypothetical protein HHI36_016731 [Cryptolaemus montrouzieri]|uniref:Uncharacterized protein n=1 Tax=Cryptolaemus montrouzieri TaxID=559131 RepID=A0ABD2NKJ9_9CUCU